MNYPIKKLCCPKCHNKLTYDKEKETLFCASDCITYPIIDGVPLMYIENKKYLSQMGCGTLLNPLSSFSLSKQSKEILLRLGIQKPGKSDVDLINRLLIEADLIRKEGSAPEIGCFEDRFGISRTKPLPQRKGWPMVKKGDVSVQLSFISHNFPREIPEGCESSFNVRIKNKGDMPLDNTKVVMAYQVFKNGDYVRDGPRTSLPISLLPGRELSLPLVFETTNLSPGEYRFEVGALIEHVKWFPDRVGIDLIIMKRSTPIDITTNLSPSSDYSDQHIYSNIWLEKMLKVHSIMPRDCLEIGCGCSPQNPAFLSSAESLICMDISHLLARLGYYIHKNHYGTKCRFISGDALSMPLTIIALTW